MKDTEKVIAKGLTSGLLGGYAGEGYVHNMKKGGGIVDGKASHVKVEGGEYHDEWITGERTGGGQEVLVIGDKKYTRVYAGGATNEPILRQLGLTVNDVGNYLVDTLRELGDTTRLSKDCTPEPDGRWQYMYKVTQIYGNTGTITGVETIHYDQLLVHVHAFAMCPIA